MKIYVFIAWLTIQQSHTKDMAFNSITGCLFNSLLWLTTKTCGKCLHGMTPNYINMKKSWNVIKMVINKRKYRQCCTKFVSNGKTVEDGKLIANRFNDFFVNVGSSLAKTIPLSPKDPTDYMIQNINVIFNINPVTGDEITKIMGQFKDSAAGWDTLKPSVMKNIKEYVKYPLAHICNLSFFTGVFPKELKLANVAPVFKANDEMIFTNYRPVSVLPVFSKLIERLMYNRLVSYINENHLLYKYQFGFQAGKATYMALIVLIEKITEALDKGESVIGIFLDFSKAFDTVDHGILLVKLHKYGVQDTALLWFQDYLTNRMQYVTYNSIKSEPKMIDCGVPQGSILGPLLFLLYINDLSTVSVSCFSILFADDTNMFITGKDIQDMCHRLNEDLVKIQEWLCCNKLSLNVSKTHYMVFTPRNKIVDDVNIMIHNEKIERVYTTKFLGVQIDAQLNWKRHIEYTCKKLSKCIGILAKARKVLYKSCLINLYYTFAYPYFIYCNQVWGNAYQTNLEKIVLVQKRLIRLITGSPYRAHTEPLFVANRILTFKEINEFTIGVFMYKSQNGDLPEIFDNYYQTHGDIHGRETRNADALYVPYGRLDIRRTSISIYGADVWNSIPTHIQRSESIDIFKRRLRCHLIDRKLHVLI